MECLLVDFLVIVSIMGAVRSRGLDRWGREFPWALFKLKLTRNQISQPLTRVERRKKVLHILRV